MFGYTTEQLNKITSCLNLIEIKGRQNCLLLESIFKTLEDGVKVNITDSQEVGENKDGTN
jgi:hypothetical protein